MPLEQLGLVWTIHSEGIAAPGSPELQQARADRKRLGGGRGSSPWVGLPRAFEGAAGLSSGDKNWIDLQADPVIREIPEKRVTVASRMGNPHACGWQGGRP